ncbi:histidinol dehydrogenase, partial [Candidatus Bathyarchaeota archaeon]|nr:histidinol dehydrogenase [Candidatus Bathyarchaeota archaeon]
MKILSSNKFKKTDLKSLMNRGKANLSTAVTVVRKIIDDVKIEGDKAILKYTEKFDKVILDSTKLKVTEKTIKEAYKKLEKKQITALRSAAKNIASFHKNQLRAKWTIQITEGVTQGQVVRPLGSVGVYAPGGKASYPSSVLMSAIPAKVAGVERIVVCSPPGKDGDVNPALLVAADIAGVNSFYRVGGAQAIAAMAYGTGTIKSVDKIVGPGN